MVEDRVQTKMKTSPEESEPKTRRRGAVLEEAILDAARAELSEVGYDRLTMEGVASRAKTNKAVLYRRWPGKPELVLATLGQQLGAFHDSSEDVPDTGSLRDDLLTYLTRLFEPLQGIEPETIRGLLSARAGTLVAVLPQAAVRLRDGNSRSMTAITKILRAAERRGEIHLGDPSARIISLPMDLMRYELFTRQEPIPEDTITRIVDDIFIPLLRGRSENHA